MQTRRWWIAAGIGGATAAAGLGWAVVSGAVAVSSDKQNADKVVPTLEFLSEEVIQPQHRSLSDWVEFSGPLVAPRTVIVRAKAAGTLTALRVSEGHRVKAGQEVGRIDLAELAGRVAERNAQVANARAALNQAERTHASNERLAAQQFISPMALDGSRAALEVARAQLNAATASLETTRVGLRDQVLSAPISGIVAKRHAVLGERVSPEQQILTLVDLQELELAGAVGTHEVSRLKANMSVQVQVEGSATLVAGRILRIAPAAEPGTRSIAVTIAIENQDERLRAGQYALARVELADDQRRLTVPATSVSQSAGQDHVWLIEGGVLARRAVTLGRRDAREGQVEVLSGLTEGQNVLAARFDNLREGAKATIVAAKASGVASAAPAPAASRAQ